VQNRTGRIECHPNCRLYLHEWRHDELQRVDVHVQEGGPGLGQPDPNGALELVSLGHCLAPETERTRDLREIRVLQFCEGIEHAFRLLLDLDKAELAVVLTPALCKVSTMISATFLLMIFDPASMISVSACALTQNKAWM